MTIIRHANNFGTTLAADITDSATSMTLASGTGLPTLSGGDGYYLTIEQSGTVEIVLVTAASGASITTMTRAQQSTSASAFTTGAYVQLRATADSFDRKQDQTANSGEDIDFSSADSFKIPQSATPDITANGHIGVDTSVTDFSTGILKYYGGEEMGVVAMPIGQFTSPADTYIVSYNATNDEFELVARNDVVDDTTPQLGGNLDCNGNFIAFDTATGINDENGNEQLIFTTTSSAVNYVGIKNAATGNGVDISAAGSDTNIDILLTPKGTGVLDVSSNNIYTTGVSFDSGSNVLDQYEEGSWTPTLDFNNTGDLSVAYTTQYGYYVRVGNMVYVTCKLECTPTFTTATQFMRVRGFSYNWALTGGCALFDHNNNIGYPSASYDTVTVFTRSVSSSEFVLFAVGDGVNRVTIDAAHITSGSSIIVAFSGVFGI